MRQKQIYVWTLFMVVGLLWLGLSTAVVQAQSQDNNIGSIRGTVYIDSNRDGQCGPTFGDPTHPGVPIEFVSNDGNFTTFLQSGDNGTYGLVAAGLGTWQVSARPNANDFVVTGTATRSVFIGAEEPLALGVDFCIVPTSGGTIPGGGLGVIAPITHLPTAGAPDNLAWFNVALLVGTLFMGAGGLVLAKSKRES